MSISRRLQNLISYSFLTSIENQIRNETYVYGLKITLQSIFCFLIFTIVLGVTQKGFYLFIVYLSKGSYERSEIIVYRGPETIRDKKNYKSKHEDLEGKDQ